MKLGEYCHNCIWNAPKKVLVWLNKKNMKNFLLLLLLLFTCALAAQDFSGQWQGILTQTNKTDTFFYQIDIRQNGTSIQGTSYSRSPNGKDVGKFELTGAWNGQQFVLQEIVQTEPLHGGWCLKYMLLQYTKKNDTEQLSGDWKSEGCSPGRIFLQRQGTNNSAFLSKEEPFTCAGRWTGQLSQSDRDYGFFYELNLTEEGSGQSNIVSEDNGGKAFHHLQWQFNPQDSLFTLTETAIASKTDPKWKWCIKSAQLRLARNTNVHILQGDWQGYLEGYTAETGKCASGKVYLEKPVETIEIQQFEQEKSAAYESETKRDVRVSRVVEVQKPTIRIKIWDSGVVDGDIITLFLNGKKIVDKYRVVKAKYAIPVTLAEDNNFLILHAEDLGDIPPNTIAVSVDDGITEQMLVLSSDLKTSGAILVKQFKIK